MGAMDRITVDGKTVNKKTRDALAWAGRKFHRRYPKAPWQVAQGSYNTTVAASAGTHDGGGVIDLRTTGAGMTADQRDYALHCLKAAGFAAWIRDERDGMPPHIHACLLASPGKFHPTMAYGARAQCISYLQGRNGLRSNGPDRNPARPRPQTRWSWKKKKPVAR